MQPTNLSIAQPPNNDSLGRRQTLKSDILWHFEDLAKRLKSKAGLEKAAMGRAQALSPSLCSYTKEELQEVFQELLLCFNEVGSLLYLNEFLCYLSVDEVPTEDFAIMLWERQEINRLAYKINFNRNESYLLEIIESKLATGLTSGMWTHVFELCLASTSIPRASWEERLRNAFNDLQFDFERENLLKWVNEPTGFDFPGLNCRLKEAIALNGGSRHLQLYLISEMFLWLGKMTGDEFASLKSLFKWDGDYELLLECMYFYNNPKFERERLCLEGWEAFELIRTLILYEINKEDLSHFLSVLVAYIGENENKLKELKFFMLVHQVDVSQQGFDLSFIKEEGKDSPPELYRLVHRIMLQERVRPKIELIKRTQDCYKLEEGLYKLWMETALTSPYPYVLNLKDWQYLARFFYKQEDFRQYGRRILQIPFQLDLITLKIQEKDFQLKKIVTGYRKKLSFFNKETLASIDQNWIRVLLKERERLVTKMKQGLRQSLPIIKALHEITKTLKDQYQT